MSLKLAVSAFAHRGVKRRQALEFLAYSGALVVVLVLLASWIVSNAESAPRRSYYYDAPPIPWSVLGLADVFSLILLGLGMFVIAPAAVAASVSSERRAGTLDQLRTTPLDPLSLLAGFALGAPARFYLLCAGPLALHVLCGLTGVIAPGAMVASLVVLSLGSLVCALAGIALALAPQNDSGGPFVSLGVAALLGLSGFAAMAMATERSGVSWAFIHPAGALNAVMISHDGLWRHLFVSPWGLDKFAEPQMSGALMLSPILSALMSLGGGALLARAACRRIAQPHRPLFGKVSAMVLFALAAAAVILPLDAIREGRSSNAAGFLPLVFGIFLLPVLALSTLLSTPDFKTWALALRSGKRPGPFADEAGPLPTVIVMLLTFLLLVSVSLNGIGFPHLMRDRHAFALAWALYTAVTVAPFVLFATTRYTTTAARTGFTVAVCAHLLFQIICIGLSTESHYAQGGERMVLEIGALLAILVPAWVVWRQRVLRARTQGTLTAPSTT